ncbi:MAG: hypothetical protein ABWY36_02135 [Leifsonia sp.]
MARYRGLTWDHPRGRDALEAAAALTLNAAGEQLIEWDVHPLEGFESSPIDELASRYDVIVLDHPHLGDALAADALRPLDTVFDTALLSSLADGCVGPSYRSYLAHGRPYALPLDAATQVAVHLSEALERAPETWADVAGLAREQPVALSLAGPHAFLSFCSLAVALGDEPSTTPGDGLLARETGRRALEILADIASRVPAGTAELNPIGLLDRMRSERDIAYIPLVYGYVTAATGPGALRFTDAPSTVPGGRIGSTIGGTGIALTRRSEPDAALVAHLAALLTPTTQARFIPENAGQPSLASAWDDDAVNAGATDFYRGTRRTIDASWVRPRVAGYVPFQAEASAILGNAMLSGRGFDDALARVDALFDALADTAAAPVPHATPERSAS